MIPRSSRLLNSSEKSQNSQTSWPPALSCLPSVRIHIPVVNAKYSMSSLASMEWPWAGLVLSLKTLFIRIVMIISCSRPPSAICIRIATCEPGMRRNFRTLSKLNRPPHTPLNSRPSSILLSSTTALSVFYFTRVSSSESRTWSPTSEEPPRSRFSWIKRSASISESISMNWKKRKAPHLIPRICPPDLLSLLISRILVSLESTTSLKIVIPVSHALNIHWSLIPMDKKDPLPRVPSPSKRSLIISQKDSTCIVENWVTFTMNAPRN